MDQGRFALGRVEMWTVRRRLSEVSARVGVGLMVLPVVLSMLYLTGKAIAPGLMSQIGGVSGTIIGSAWLGAWLLFGPLAFLVSLFASMRARLPHTRLSVKDGSLTLEGGQARTFARKEIDGAMVVVSHTGPPHAEIALRSGDVLHVHAGSGNDAEDDYGLVDALGFGGVERRTSLPLGGTRGLFGRGLAAIGAGVVAMIVSAFVALAVTSSLEASLFVVLSAFLMTVLAVARVAGPHRVVAGADGIVLQRLFGSTFLPRRHIFGVEAIQGGVSVLLRGDDEEIKQVPLPADRPERSNALLKALREALSSEPKDADHSAGAALLARGGESIGTWRERLRKLTVAEGGYRTRRLSVETLVRTARDPSAPAELRIGAAMAIAGTDDADAKTRLRIATEGVANEEVRRALEAACEAEAEDEAIAAALERAERETKARG